MIPSDRVLIVDDDASLLAGLVRHLGERFDLMTAQDGKAALDAVRTQGPFAAVLCDMRMPGMDGIEVLRHLTELAPDTVRMMLTGNADLRTAVDAVNQGSIFRFFTKPTPIAVLAEGFDAAIRQYHLIVAEHQLLAETLAGSVALLIDVLALVAPETFQRSRRIRSWAVSVAAHMKLDKPWVIKLAADLAYLGAIAVPPDILARHHAGQNLTATEMDMISHIPEVGAKLIRRVPRLGPVADAVQFQEVPFRSEDQPPSGLPIAARILNVLSQLDQTGAGIPSREALMELYRQPNRFDPAVLAAVKVCLVDDGTQPAASMKSKHIDVSATGILAGDILETDLRLENGALVLASGETITEIIFLRLHNLRRTSIFKEPIRVLR